MHGEGQNHTQPVPKWCPLCEETFDAHVEHCPTDGVRLRRPPLDEELDPLIGRVFLDRFEVQERIGQGAMGAVYRAWQRSVDRPVALKLLHPEIKSETTVVKRFLLEARATSRLTNPHTITIYDFGETDDGILFIAMEYLQGQSMRELIEDDGPIDADIAVPIMAQVADSLAEAHGQDIVHRDLKPENVFLTDTDTRGYAAKVLDFGIARATTLTGDSKITKHGSVAGTPKYMSPEAGESKPVDARADVYAMGVMLYELVAGRAPFEGDTPLATLVAHINTEPPPFEEVAPDVIVPEPVRALVFRCLAKDPDERPANGGEMRDALSRAYEEMLGTSPGTSPGVDTLSALGLDPRVAMPVSSGLTRPMRRAAVVPQGRRSMLALAAAVLVIGAVAAVLVGLGDDDEAAADGSEIAAVAAPVSPAAGAESVGKESTDSVIAKPADGTKEPGAGTAAVPEPTPETPPGGDSVAPPEPEPLPAEVTITIISDPEGADLMRGAVILGSTPATIKLPRGKEPVGLRLVMLGRVIDIFDVVPDADQELKRTLKRKRGISSTHKRKMDQLLP